jgi:hypothetical protein
MAFVVGILQDTAVVAETVAAAATDIARAVMMTTGDGMTDTVPAAGLVPVIAAAPVVILPRGGSIAGTTIPGPRPPRSTRPQPHQRQLRM